MIVNAREMQGSDFCHYSFALGKKKIARIIEITQDANRTDYNFFLMLHAFSGNRFSWLTHFSWVSANLGNAIIVLPESGRRWFINDVEGFHYEDYIIQDLLPLVFEKYSTFRWKHKIIGGFSMGGACALIMGLKYSYLFDTVFSYSGAFSAPSRVGDPYAHLRMLDGTLLIPNEKEHVSVWGSENSSTRKTYHLPNVISSYRIDNDSRFNILLSVGSEDYPRIVQMNREAHQLLLTEAITHRYHEIPGGHNWVSAAKAFEYAINLFQLNL